MPPVHLPTATGGCCALPPGSCARLIFRLLAIFGPLVGAQLTLAASTYQQIDLPPHLYRERTPADRFTRLKDDLESGRIPLDRSSEKDFVISLLRALEVPVSSQMLVFSTTSLQLRLITPSNPRALYFTDDLYVGYIPGGRIEIVSLDPELGAIFYIFDMPREAANIRVERSARCMNCHSAEDTGNVPGLVMKSVVPGLRGGSLAAYRQEQTGHGIPFEDRFGGWYVTGKHSIAEHWGNAIGRYVEGKFAKNPIDPATAFDIARYPTATSDILPQLLLEHQAGFVNRVVQASYRARTALHASQGRLDDAQSRELDEQASVVTRYLLFADEVPLPVGGVEGDSAFKSDFLRNRRVATGDVSLKDFDLSRRLFRNRCSYMIYSPVFQGLPAEMKRRIYDTLKSALDSEKPHAEYAYLPAAEKQSIREILRATLPDLPSGW